MVSNGDLFGFFLLQGKLVLHGNELYVVRIDHRAFKRASEFGIDGVYDVTVSAVGITMK